MDPWEVVIRLVNMACLLTFGLYAVYRITNAWVAPKHTVNQHEHHGLGDDSDPADWWMNGTEGQEEDV